MKIATYNVNGVNGRLPVLLRWLAETKPDVVCLQELKAPDEKFPALLTPAGTPHRALFLQASAAIPAACHLHRSHCRLLFS